MRVETARAAREAQREAQRQVDQAMRESQREIEAAQRQIERERVRAERTEVRIEIIVRTAAAVITVSEFTAKETKTFTVGNAPRITLSAPSTVRLPFMVGTNRK